MDPLTLLTLFAPVAIDVVKRLVGRFTGGPAPQTVDELLKVKEADLRQLEAISAMDSAEGADSWVINIRGIIRPAIAILVTVTWSVVVVFDLAVTDEVYRMVTDLASCVIFYLFGERMYMGLDGRKR